MNMTKLIVAFRNFTNAPEKLYSTPSSPDYFNLIWIPLLDDLKDRTGHSHLKEEALYRTLWRNRFRGGFGPVVRQNTE
jgi:hypothetical protein